MSPWLIRGEDIVREYVYGNDEMRFQIHVTLGGGLIRVSQHVNFFLIPIVVAGEGFAVGQFSVWGERIDTPFITFRSTEVPGGANLFGIMDRTAADEAVAKLNRGIDLQFQIVSKQGVLVDLLVPNDATFAECYRPLFERITRENPIRFP